MEKEVEVVFLQSAGSSPVGPFKVGDERPIPEHHARRWRKRGVCKYKRQIMAQGMAKPKKGVKGDGD